MSDESFEDDAVEMAAMPSSMSAPDHGRPRLMTDESFEEIRADSDEVARLRGATTERILNTLRVLQAGVDETHNLHTQAKVRLDTFIAAVMRLDPSERPLIAEMTAIVRLERGRLYQIRGPREEKP